LGVLDASVACSGLVVVWVSNFFYTYQFNSAHSILFTLRTKGLNTFYWGTQMMAPLASAASLASGSPTRG
jgi:hypothetical protein